MKKYIPYLIATLLIAFGLLTLFLSSSVIFDLFNIRAKEGNYVLFVVLANFISSLLYLLAAYGILTLKKWPPFMLIISAIILVSAYLGLKIHANSGGLYEAKTMSAMIFRITITVIFSIISYFNLKTIKN